MHLLELVLQELQRLAVVPIRSSFDAFVHKAFIILYHVWVCLHCLPVFYVTRGLSEQMYKLRK